LTGYETEINLKVFLSRLKIYDDFK